MTEYRILNPSLDTRVADCYHIYTNGSKLDGFRVGGFVEVHGANGFLNVEVSYSSNSSIIQFHNLKWEEDLATYGTGVSIDASGIYTNNMCGISLSRGLLIKRKLSVEGGLFGALQLKDVAYSGFPDSYFTNPATMTQIIYRLADSYNRLILIGSVRLSYLFGPLKVFSSFEKSLTAASSGIVFDGEKYPIRYEIKIWSIGVSYMLLGNRK